MDQRRFDNQRWLTSAQAATRLGVRRETLYAYVSRRLLRSEPPAEGRGRRYHAADVERLRARARARAGHGAVASGALLWGEPVLDTEISSIGAEGPAYRGRTATSLAGREPFESVASRLWEGDPGPAPARGLGIDVARAAALAKGARPIESLAIVLPILALGDPDRFGSSAAAERDRARTLVGRLAALAGLGRGAAHVERAAKGATVASRLAVALGGTARAAKAIDVALVLTADHELNASTFAARIAASAGADLHACLTAALATLSGPRHGGACDRVEALVDEVADPRRAAAAVQARARLGEEVPGFGHPLYPAGDPRAQPLLDLALRIAPRTRGVAVVRALVDAMRASGRAAPTIDAGLVALVHALGLVPGSAAAIFAVGRTAGWVAHVLEQRATGTLLRPRARYVGPPSTPARSPA